MTKEELELKLFDRPNSPLFARLADEYLASNRIDEAKKICTEGLKSFPRYGTAHLVLSKCHFVENNFALALASVESAQACIPDPEVLEGLCDELLAIISKGGGLQSTVERTMETEEEKIVTEPAQPVAAVEEEVGIPEATEESPAPLIRTTPPSSIEDQREIESGETIEVTGIPITESDQPAEPSTEMVEEHPLESRSIEEAPAIPTQAPAAPDEILEEQISEETAGEILPTVESHPDQVPVEHIGDGRPPVVEETAAVTPIHEDQPPQQELAPQVGLPVEHVVPEKTAEPAPAAAGKQDVPEYQPTETDRIITRTLAEIYASQKAYEEAIVTYRLLKEQKPDRVDEIDARIAELQKLQQEKTKE